MLFSEPTFLFCFLPWLLLIYFGVPSGLKDAVLLLGSLCFYAWGEPRYVFLMLASIGLNYTAGLLVAPRAARKPARWWLAAAIFANLGILVVFKYADFVIRNFNTVLALFPIKPVEAPRIALPVGISFFTFQGLSYVLDVFRGECAPQRSILKLALYKSLFPQLIAGPIVRYVDIQEQIHNRSVTLDGFASGVNRFVIGLGKKMILADTVARPADGIFSLPADQLSAGIAWLGIFCYALQIYLDFSAYSDMAIGLGRMFGFEFLENFNYPYLAQSMTEFWRRWHISLSTWFRDYLYIPLGGNRGSAGRTYFNLLCVFFLCGLWHGASWNFVIWGLFHGLFLSIERARSLRGRRIRFAPLRRAYVFAVVLVSWVFFRSDSLGQSMCFLKAMAGLSTPGDAVPGFGMFLNPFVMVVLVAGIVACTPATKGLWELANSWEARTRRVVAAASILRTGAVILILLYAALLMASGSYSPFIYYRF